jgi:type IV secretory pathway TraG/TraD family ATPase VirD4
MSIRADVAASRNGGRSVAQNEPWNALFGADGSAAGIPLGTAQWMSPQLAIERFGVPGHLDSGHVFIGDAFDNQSTALAYRDDRHVCLVSGSRGGKGVGVIVPNLCFWPGSAIVVDPKGENATVTARRRGAGSAYSHSMGQKVCILDPFNEVQLPAFLKARYNPLDAIDPESDFAIDDAGRVAAAIVVVESRNDPYWEEAARNLIKGLILHVLSAPSLKQHRNLLAVRRLLTQGDWLSIETLRQAGDTDMPSAFNLLWQQMRRNSAFNGVVAGVGEQMASMADKQRSGVMESARTNTEFLDSSPMQRLLEKSDFDLGELKTNPRGLTIYLTLPARFMATHYRWLRLMISLAIGEMERIKGRPATGHPTLFLLDEFAGLKRMEVVEHAAAQAAGFGVKFLFVVQNLPQIEDLYEKSWETFLGNSGLKLFFQIDDDFTRSYLARQLGETETTRQSRSGSEAQSNSFSKTAGQSTAQNYGESTSRRPILNFRTSKQASSGSSNSSSSSDSWGNSTSTTQGWGEAVHKRSLLNPDEIGRMLARNDDRRRPGYPGLVLALIPGEHPLLARRVNYFESPQFLGYFDPHPDHPPPPTLAELSARTTEPPLRLVEPPRARSLSMMPSWSYLVIAALFIGVPLLLSRWPASTSSGVTYSPPPSSAPSSEVSVNYAQGVADWDLLKIWVSYQKGEDRRAGIDYWSANRNVRNHLSCEEASEQYSGNSRSQAQFGAGCLASQNHLQPIDLRRNTDPQYKAGFNDQAKRSPL